MKNCGLKCILITWFLSHEGLTTESETKGILKHQATVKWYETANPLFSFSQEYIALTPLFHLAET